MSASDTLTGETGSQPNPTPNPEPTPSPTPNPTPSDEPTGDFDWKVGLSDDLKGYVDNKGFKDIPSIVDSYKSLEKLVGVKDQLLKMPDTSNEEEVNAFYNKLGRPESPDKYEFDLEEGTFEEGFEDWARKTFHEKGLTQDQAISVLKEYSAFAKSNQEAEVETYNTQVQQEQTELQKEWGAAYEQNINKAKGAAAQFGFDAKVIDSLEAGLGYKGVMKFLNGLAEKVGEDKFIGSGSTGSLNSFALTPAQAKSKIQDLKLDKAFRDKLLAKDQKSVQEWEQLHKLAYNN